MVVAHEPAQFDCHHCHTRFCDDTKPAKYPIWRIDEEGIASRTCFKPMAGDDFVSPMLWDLWCAWRDRNVLPAAGGYGDQWQRHIDMFSVCQKFEADRRAETAAAGGK